MLPVVTAEQMRGIDKETITVRGIPGAVLMENAGRAVVACVERLLAAGPNSKVVVLCGAGNNGGDGYVVARVLGERGVAVTLYAAAPVKTLGGDAKLHADAFVACGGAALALTNAEELGRAGEELEQAAVVVDALFGTGLDRPIEGHWRAIVETINAAPGKVVAVDLPSGLRSDDGRTMGIAVQADETVTFACAKVALVGSPGFESCGRLSIAEMGIPKALALDRAEIGFLERQDIQEGLGGDSPGAHKGTRGHVLLIAGSPGKYGAGRLAGLAALRAGCGLATLAACSADTSAEDPLMTAVVATPKDLGGLLVGKGAALIGPGMTPGPEGRKLVLGLLQDCELPMVLDADGLNHLGSDLSPVASAKGVVVLTPHPGEAARLLGTSSAEVQADRIAAVRKLAAVSKAIVVLKGARTCVCDGRSGDAFVAINPTGGPELSTGGTGDVLAGVLSALLARGVEPGLAAWVSVYWHGEAGRVASAELGGPGMVASDLLAALPSSRTQLLGA